MVNRKLKKSTCALIRIRTLYFGFRELEDSATMETNVSHFTQINIVGPNGLSFGFVVLMVYNLKTGCHSDESSHEMLFAPFKIPALNFISV